MIQDIQPHVLHNEFIPDRPVDGSGLLFLFREDSVLCAIEDDRVRLPRVDQLPGGPERRYLFALDDVPCYLGMEVEPETPEGMEWVAVRMLRRRAAGPREAIFAAWTAFQLYNWYRDNRFCGRCGAVTRLAPDERAVECPQTEAPPPGRRSIPGSVIWVPGGAGLLMASEVIRRLTGAW